MMPLQRACDAESQPRVQSNVRSREMRVLQSILQRGAYVSCRGYAGIPLRARVMP